MDDRSTGLGTGNAAASIDKATIRLIIGGVMLAMLLGAIDQTIVVTALPTIGNELHDFANLQWVVTAYLLSATAVTPLYGKLADIVGRRRTLLTAIVIFLIGSVLCALSRTMPMLITARFIQGIGGGSLIVLGHTIVGDVVAPAERLRYQAVISSVFVVSSVAGPVAGGFFAEHLHWSFIFWINLPLGALAYFISSGVLRRLPRHERPHRLDFIGAGLMAAAAITLLLALSWGGTAYAWDSGQVIGLFALSVALWVLFAIRLLTAAEPFIPLHIMRDPVMATATTASFFVYGAMIAFPTILPMYFEAVVGLTAGQSGAAFIGFMLATVIGARISGMAMSIHHKLAPVAGLLLAIVACAVLGFQPSQPFIVLQALLFVIGLGVGTCLPVVMVSVQNAVAVHHLGTATASFNFFRALGAAILVAGFNSLLVAGLSAIGHATDTPQKLMAEAAARGIPIAPAFGHVFLAAGSAMAIGLVFVLMIPYRPLRNTTWTIE